MLNFWDLKTWSQRDRPLGPHDLYLIVPGKARNGSTGSLVTSAVRMCIPNTDSTATSMIHSSFHIHFLPLQTKWFQI